MKALSVLLVVMVILAGASGRRSSATEAASSSLAFRQCQEAPAAFAGRCGPLDKRLLAMVDESDFGSTTTGDNFGSVDANVGGDTATPEHSLLVHLLAVLFTAALEFTRHIMGGNLPIALDYLANAELFDPVR